MATNKGNPRQAAGIAKVAKLIKGIKFAMLTTAEADGSLRSRPMATQRGAFDGTLWFFTRASSHKVEEVRQDRHVNVAYADPDDQRYVSVSGKARLVRDKGKMKEFWSPAYKVWFPQGLEDPDVALLRVDVTEAEYWDSPSGTMVYLIGMAKAAVTGRPPKASEVGENKKVRLAGGRGREAADRWSSPAGEPVRRRARAGR
jgi:general stress protein 26